MIHTLVLAAMANIICNDQWKKLSNQDLHALEITIKFRLMQVSDELNRRIKEESK